MTNLAFEPAFPIANPHLQTIVGRFLAAPDPRGGRESFVVPVTATGSVRCDVIRPEGREPRGTALLVHGLAGCAESHYIRHTAHEALTRGFVAVRMNLRGCGGTAALSRSLHNAGQSDDVRRVFEALDRAGFPRPFVAAGVSLGGNLVLREAALAGKSSLADAIAAVNPPIDLALCAREIDAPRNLVYRFYFVQQLCALVETARKIFDLPGPTARPWEIRTLWRFDDLYTAPHAGYETAAHYYAAASAGPLLEGLTIPALVLSAKDDPFVPASMFDALPRRHLPTLRLAQPSRGGHVGYVGRNGHRFWAGGALFEWFDEILAR